LSAQSRRIILIVKNETVAQPLDGAKGRPLRGKYELKIMKYKMEARLGFAYRGL